MKPDLSNSSTPKAVDQLAVRGGSRIISRVLPPAVRLWIQSQLDHVEALEFRLEGRDRQILSGYVPQVSLVADKAVYEGLHLSHVKAAATEIRINLGQILRGKPLRLLQPFPVKGHVCLLAADLLVSLHSPLLSQGLQEVLLRLVNAHPALFPEHSHIRALIADFSSAPATTRIDLASDQLTLTWESGSLGSETVSLQTDLQVKGGHLLCLDQPLVTVASVDGAPSPPICLDDYVIDLGPEVDIHTLTVRQDLIEVQGTIKVVPAG